MRVWWVNQNQTFDEETRGGYLWSPKRKRDGSKNTFYDNMSKVKPGDIVLSFRGLTFVLLESSRQLDIVSANHRNLDLQAAIGMWMDGKSMYCISPFVDQ